MPDGRTNRRWKIGATSQTAANLPWQTYQCPRRSVWVAVQCIYPLLRPTKNEKKKSWLPKKIDCRMDLSIRWNRRRRKVKWKSTVNYRNGKGPSINYVVSKSPIFDPLPPSPCRRFFKYSLFSKSSLGLPPSYEGEWYGTIHLRRRHVLGGEGGSPLLTFADARGVGVSRMPTSAIFDIIRRQIPTCR